MLLNIDDYRRQARRKLPRFVFDYVEGAAGDERCRERNGSDLEGLQLVSTCLRDTSTIDTSLTIFGQRWNAPIGVAPIGFSGLVHPRGDSFLARAAAAQGLPFVLSTASNTRLETVRTAASDGLQWMQLYVMSDRTIAEQLIRRARQANYGALVLTVDVPVNGNRERDVRNGFRLPFRPTLRTLLNLSRHPAWLLRVARYGMPSFVNLSESQEAGASAQVQAALLARAMDRKLVWESLAWIRSLWDGPLLIKGLLHPYDAARALNHGVDGLVVSNHGGRQLDAAVSTIAALPAIVDKVVGRVPVFVDSGFRRGSDIVKALALGASAVFVGRPAVYGMACGGEPGARAVLQLLRDELERTMILLGAPSLRDIERRHLFPAP